MDLEKYKVNYAEISKIQATKNEDYYKNPSKYYVHPFRIIENLYYIGDQKVCSHLIDTGDGLIVFDSGFQHTVHLMVQAVWELGYSPSDIKYLIHSHEHFDHIGAANDFKTLYGCKLVISRAGAEVFRKYPERVFMHANPNPYAYPFTPDIELTDGQIIQLGNVSIRCVETPGHSDGVMSFFFDMEDQGKMYHIGYFGGMGFNTLYQQALTELGRPLTARQDFLNSLQKVRNESVDITLGNHPAQNKTLEKLELLKKNPSSNPFINSNEWAETIDTLRDKFKEFIENGN